MKDEKVTDRSSQSSDPHLSDENVGWTDSEAKWQSLVSNAPNYITIVNQSGLVEFINHTVPGITTRDVIGQSVYDFVMPEYRDLARRKINHVFESGEADYYESAAAGPDGSVAFYENHLGPIKQGNKVVAVTFIATDITKRKEAEETISSLAQFPSENHSPVMRISKDGQVLYANKASTPLLALWASQVGQKLPESWHYIVADAIRSGVELTREIVCDDKIYSMQISPVIDAGYANLYGHDITQHKHAEKLIRDIARFPKENRNPVMRVSQNGEILYANEASEPLLVLWSSQIGQKLPVEWCRKITDALFSGELITYEVNCEGRIFSIQVTPITREGYVNLYGRDITEQKQVEELLKTQNSFINNVFESLSHPFYVVDADDYTIRMANTAANIADLPVRITCYALTHFRDTPCDGVEHLCPLTEIKRTGKPVTLQHIHRHRDGKRRYYEVHGHPILDSVGNVTQIIEYTLDITDRVSAEEALRTSRDELELRVQERTAELEELNKVLQEAVNQNARLFIAEQQARTTAETLSSASLSLTQTLSLGAVINTLLDYMHQLIPYDSACFLMPYDETHLVVRATRHYEQWAEAQFSEDFLLETKNSLHMTSILDQRTSVLISDTRGLNSWKHFAGLHQVKSWLGVPLLAEDKVIGICTLDKKEPGFFTAQYRLLAELLANQAAVALQNAWLFEQVSAGRERLRMLSRKLVEVQETERKYIARELHDEAGQVLTSLMVGLRLLEREAQDPDAVIAGTGELIQSLDTVLENLHRLAADLRPASLDHLGLVAALRQYAESISIRHNLEVQFETIGFEAQLPSEIEITIYRIVQEALTNVVRHAHATRVDILLEQQRNRIIAFVEDNGKGFDADKGVQDGRLGLFGMRERTEMLGGSLVLESSCDSGTTLRMEIPYADTDSDRG